MLSLVTKEFAVVTADVDERAAEIKMEEEGAPALKVSEHLAEIKAKAVFDSLSEEEKENSIVIGADTSVILGDVIYGKPEDREDAEDAFIYVRKRACRRDRSRSFRRVEKEHIHRRNTR